MKNATFFGITPRKKLSQTFLVDERVLAREVEYARVNGKEVLEIGAGTGNLTERLALGGARRVIAVEKDARLIEALGERLRAHPNVVVVHADFLDYEIEKTDVIVSNVPYSISSPLTFKLVDIGFERAVLCFQKEFAKRMVARPDTSNYSRLSVMSQLCFDARILETVPRGAFYPIPKVDSAIVELTKTGRTLAEFQKKFITALFTHKNKTVRNALIDSSKFLGKNKKQTREIAGRASAKERRVFTLSKEEILGLCAEMEEFFR